MAHDSAISEDHEDDDYQCRRTLLTSVMDF